MDNTATQTEQQDQVVEEPKPEAKPEPAPKKVLDPILDTVEPDPVFHSKAEKTAHEDKVRNEGLKLMMFKPKHKSDDEIDLEIEAPGAATSVAESGAKTI
jgi:hypothetical protein